MKLTTILKGTIASVVFAMGALVSGVQAEVSNSEMESFAAAYVDIVNIRQEFAPQMDEAANEEEMAELQSAVMDRMSNAVESNGLSLDRYNEIVDQIQGDDELEQRVVEEIQKLTSE